METIELPPAHVNVMLTYRGTVRVPDGGYGRDEIQTVTRRAFYSDSKGYYDRTNQWIDAPNGFFHVPQFWQNFTFSDGAVAVLPHGFYSYGRVLPKDVIKWELDKTERL